MNSKPIVAYASMLNPTLNNQAGDIARIPYIYSEKHAPEIDALAQSCIDLVKTDWDSFETSWNFERHPLLKYDAAKISDAMAQWTAECDERFATLKANEERLNEIFIEIYGFQDELTPDVEDKYVSVRRADRAREVRSLISYAVGCMFGRYSLDTPGLAYAGGPWDASKWTTFIPDADNIIPITDTEYFDDDIVSRFVEWTRAAFGDEHLDENLSYITESLEIAGPSRDALRKYFLTKFYEDHLKIYQKRPIYWQFTSGKKNAFNALCYMHRITPTLLASMRIDYIHELQSRLETRLEHIRATIETADSATRRKLSTELKTLTDQAKELHTYEENVHHLADQQIAIDLDDGVKHNYPLFGSILAKIK